MQKKILAAAVATSLVALGAGQAQAAISDTGDVLIVPYYTTESGNDTLINLVNTTDQFKAIKVRFRESRGSEDSLDFHVYMSPRDVWTAAMTRNPDGVPTLVTSDTSCTFGVVGNDPATSGATVKTTYVDRAVTRLSSLSPAVTYAGPSAASRIREGYVEIIEMATLATTNSADPAVQETFLSHYAKHVNGVPRDCSVFASLNTQLSSLTPASYLGAGPVAPAGDISVTHQYNGNTRLIRIKAEAAAPGVATSDQFKNRSGGLFANAAIINVDDATYIPMEVVALDTLATEIGDAHPIFFSQSDSVNVALEDYTADEGLKWVKGAGNLQFWDLPDLSTVVTSAGAAETALDLTGAPAGTYGPYTAFDTTGGAALEAARVRAGAVSSMIAARGIANEFIVDPALNAETDWVVTLPSKRFFVTGSVANGAAGVVANHLSGAAFAGTGAGNLTRAQNYFFNGFNYRLGQSCEPVGVRIWDREETERTPAPGTGFSPGLPDGTGFDLCGEANVVAMLPGTSAAVTGATPVLGAQSAVGIAVGNFADGWIQLDLTKDSNNTNGLPVVGFSAVQFENEGFSASGALNVYGGGFRHRVTD